MNIKIQPRLLKGEVPAIPSKSHGHRLLICAALAGNPEDAQVNIPSQDILATKECLLQLLQGVPDISRGIVLDCRESGSTLRFLLPIAMALAPQVTFLRKGRLKTRPLSPLREEMEAHGCTFTERNEGSLYVEGPMKGGKFSIAGNISSQFVSGLLMALPLFPQGGSIHLTTPLESAPYVDLTLRVLNEFGISVQVEENIYRIPGGQHFRSPGIRQAEGDWSNAAFFLTAASLGSQVVSTGLDPGSAQGDKTILPLLEKFDREEARIIDASHIPDLVPILSVKAALTSGTTRITGARRLRIKESDRLAAMTENITALGGNIHIEDEGLFITGSPLKGGQVKGFNDHRIVMSMAIAATRCSEAVTISGAEAVNKSYPSFFEEFRRLGGTYDQVDLR